MPSFPVAAMGRNEHIAWTGTNMWGLNSYLYELNAEDLKMARVRKEVFKARFAKDRTLQIVETDYGPLVSDTAFLKSEKPLALKWSGHIASKELEAFYKTNLAKDISEFKSSFKDYGVVALNYVAADNNNEIIKIHATQLPVLKEESKSFIQKKSNKLVDYYDVDDFPETRNPKKGYVVSSNEKVVVKNREACWFCSVGERLERISSLIEASDKIGVDEVKKIHQDVYSESAGEIIKKLFEVYGDYKVRLPSQYEHLLQWDQIYHQDSIGAYLFEETLQMLAGLVHDEYELTDLQRRLSFEHYSWRSKILNQLTGLSDEQVVEVLENLTVEVDSMRLREWGDVHQLRFAHNFVGAPLVGRFFILYRGKYPGATSTVFKAAFSDGKGNYKANFGANLRVIFDLSDKDENYGVLLGGQDGFWGAHQAEDQIKTWLEGDYLKLPFTEDKIEEAKVFETRL
jgi:penicillin amidase